MQIVPVVTNGLLQMSVEAQTCTPVPFARGEAGRLTLQLVMTNRSDHVAQLPFLCLTDLGLNIGAASGWRADKITSRGRRMVRVAAIKSITLRPGESTPVGALEVKWRCQGGFVVSIDAGAGRLAADATGIRICCIAGAANFPMERLQLVIPTATIYRAVERGTLIRTAGNVRERLAASC